ncbi:tetratricopeptide repeat protein [Lysobacter sp. CFH 32150]|uniref:tetratricopeptide repeat protein n=1 Tax=Lysobacter sp. CFH 32150 TaxID=2927128 RepID=UPI001FA6D9B6|nr:tetratricopeptide repeat protein [Lysobacter sp. CFH 32150]MCI4568958.1 tetratricopeptide repeat protein [Lysobacter sp. CFH 32150]
MVNGKRTGSGTDTTSGARARRPALRVFGTGLAMLALLMGVGTANGQGQQHAGHALGTVDFPVSCSAPARAEFNRAMALLHHMTYPQARTAFEQVVATDPDCAMAHWGVAVTLFQPLWPTRPRPPELQRGWEEVQKAKALQPPTERERLFVAAAEAFFLEPESSDYWLRIRRWQEATAKLYAALPDDSEVAAFQALALLATAPANALSRTNPDKAAAILLRVYEKNPDHPGAMHYLVHANDVPGRERESLDILRKYEHVAPNNPHALHMPTHIYTRLGDWDAVERGNLRAAEAALQHPAGDKGQFVWDEFPHAIEYLVYAYLQQGDDASAAAQLQRLRATAHLEPSFKTAFHLASTQARYALERRAWNEAAAIVPREPAILDWDRFAWPEAIAQFAHGLGAVRVGKADDAKAVVARLEVLEAATRKAGEDLFARNIQVLRLELSAWIANAAGQRESSVALMREAAELETSTPKHPVTPGPTLPAYEQLGDLLMEQKQPGEALAAYQRGMTLYPNRFNSVLGAARAASALGDKAQARGFYEALIKIAGKGTRAPALQEARAAGS